MIGHLLVLAWACVALMMLMLWFVQVRTKNASYVDIGWTFGLFLCCGIYANLSGPISNPRKVLIFLMVMFWALRLCYLLADRLRKDPNEDSRYARIRSDWKTNQDLKFFFMFQFQGLLDVVLSWGFLLICLNPAMPFSPLESVGVLLWVVAFIGEILADSQLKRFKADPTNKGKTCQVGLWKYSRHPNYFFEWLMWVAYFVMALAAPWGWTAVILPVLMYYFLMHISGVPLAEAQALKTRGEEYRKYKQTTSMFVPWFKNRRL